MMGKETLEALLDLLLLDCRTQIFRAVHDANAESVKTFVGHPKATPGQRHLVFGLDSTVAYDPESPGNKPNPNTYCGFIKFLTELGGDDREQMIYKLTGRPAEILHFQKRGTLAPGKQADVLVIDWDRLKTNENVLDPAVYPGASSTCWSTARPSSATDSTPARCPAASSAGRTAEKTRRFA